MALGISLRSCIGAISTELFSFFIKFLLCGRTLRWAISVLQYYLGHVDMDGSGHLDLWSISPQFPVEYISLI